MEEMFKEQLVKRLPNYKDILMKILIAIAGFIVDIAVFIIFPSITFFVVAVTVCFLILIYRKMEIEYEYVLTNTDFEINRIFSKSSHRKYLQFDLRDFTAMVPALNKEYAHEVKDYEKSIDCSSGVLQDDTYYVIISKGGKTTRLVIEPNEKMVKAMKMYIPRIIRM